jgi:hypothetical protein
MQRRRRQAGSISVVWLFLVLTTMLLLVLFIDREWVNYQVRKARQTADFAAEAGAAAAQITYHLQVTGRQGHPESRPVEGCADCPPETVWVYEPWSTHCSGAEADLSGTGWLEQCGCTAHSDQVDIDCRQVQQLTPTIDWPSDVDEIVEATFWANWVDRPNSRVIQLLPFQYERIDRRLSQLYVKVRLNSLFGGGWWPAYEPDVIGKSTLKIPPLRLSGP